MSRNEQIEATLRKVCNDCDVPGCKGYPEQKCEDFDDKVTSTTFLRKV